MASRLNEEMMRTNLDVPEGEIEVKGAANPVYVDTINVHDKKKKEIEKTLKDADKEPELKEPFTGSTDKKNMPKEVEFPKVKLEESLFEDVRPVREAYAYDGAAEMGSAHCSPLVPDFSSSIRDYVKHYGEDEKYDSVIMSSLKHMVVRLLDSKQEVENFNAYWRERYPLLIDYIDDQIALIPFDVLNYGDGRVKEGLHEEAPKYVKGEIYYKSTRDPLADIIMDELTFGEVVYRYKGLNDAGKEVWVPTNTPGLGLDAEETALRYNDDWTVPYVQAHAYDEGTLNAIKEIGKKYNREVTDKFVSTEAKPYWVVKIQLKPGDDEEPFVDDNVQVRGGKVGK